MHCNNKEVLFVVSLSD